jgi:hypothetical protein
MSSVLGAFRDGPQWDLMTDSNVLERARDLPVGYGEMFRNTVVESFVTSPGLGTAIREAGTPDRVPSRDVVVPQELETRDPLVPPTLGGEDGPVRFRPPAGTFLEDEEEAKQRRAAAGVLTKEEWQASPSFRDKIPYDPGMTADRASALASWYDASQARQAIIDKGPGGFLGNAIWLGGMLAGSLPDPVNYIPILGPEVRAAQIARFGRLGGSAAVSSADAALNTAIMSGLTAGTRQSFGDDVTWQSWLTDVAIGAAIGGAFGAATSRWEGWQQSRAANEIKAVVEARAALNDAMGDVLHGRPVEITPTVADAVEKAATRLESPTIKRPDGATVEESVRGSGKGQTDLTLTVKNAKGDVVGRLDYAEFDGVPNIDMVSVSEGARRQGFGALLVRELQARYPDTEINWGMLTEDGARLRDALPVKTIEDADVVARTNELTSLKEEYALMEQRIAEFEKIASPSPEDVARVQSQTDGMNNLYDRISQVEKEIEGRPAARRIVLTEDSRRMDAVAARPDAPDPSVTAAASSVGKRPASAAAEFGMDKVSAPAKAAEPAAPAKQEVKVLRGEDGRISGAEISKPAQDLADQFGIDSKSGDFPEMAEFEQLVAMGRVTPDEMADFAKATAIQEQTDAYARGLEAATICRVGA